MNKRELRKLKSIMATPEIIEISENDPPQKIGSGYSAQIGYHYKRYYRTRVVGKILIIAIFLPEYIRAGSRFPAYELYIDRAHKKFITYSHVEKRWSNAKIDCIDWPGYVFCSTEDWISANDDARIKSYLGTSNGGFYGILSYQQGIRHEELVARHKRETDPWDADLKQIPPYPHSWSRWVAKEGVPFNFIYYHYRKGGAKTGYCTHCERDVPIQKHRHNEMGQCPRCHCEVQYKATGRAGVINTPTVPVYLIQKCKDGFVVREFEATCRYAPGDYKSPVCGFWETRRVIYSPDAWNLRAYVWGDYKQVSYRWNRVGLCSPHTNFEERGRVFPHTLADLGKTYLHTTGLVEKIKLCPNGIDPEVFLAKYCHAEKVKMLKKAKLSALAKDYSSYPGMLHGLSITQKGNLAKMLGIDQYRLGRLRANKGGGAYLEWLISEKSQNRLIPDYVISWFCEQNIREENLKFISDRMSFLQIYNYIHRQMSDCKMTSTQVLHTWRDYLSMAAMYDLDVKDEIIYRVKLLRQRHDELVLLQKTKDSEARALELEQKFPHVSELCLSLKKKYEYSDDTYTVLAPSSILDIVMEGRALSHCVSNCDIYCERIERNESFILFLRLTTMPQTSYYTLEVEPGGTIRQKRTTFDRQNDDIKDAEAFLRKWQSVVSARMSAKDKDEAVKSKVLRVEMFSELQEKNVTINTGELAGHLLADVLMADLMEVA